MVTENEPVEGGGEVCPVEKLPCKGNGGELGWPVISILTCHLL